MPEFLLPNSFSLCSEIPHIFPAYLLAVQLLNYTNHSNNSSQSVQISHNTLWFPSESSLTIELIFLWGRKPSEAQLFLPALWNQLYGWCSGLWGLLYSTVFSCYAILNFIHILYLLYQFSNVGLSVALGLAFTFSYVLYYHKSHNLSMQFCVCVWLNS